MKQRIDSPTDKESQWIAAQLEGVGLFVEAFSPDDAGQPITLQALDRAFAAWLTTNETDQTMVNSAINVIGIAFGQTLVDGIGFQWVIATDEQGSDLAVHGLQGKGDVLVYPANFVAKRWERRESGFIARSYNQIAQQVQAVRDGRVQETGGKPWWKFW
jgi:hypothetical protein